MKVKTKKAGKASPANNLLHYAIQGIEEKKGNEIVTINFKKIPNSPCDYFLICEGGSRTQVQAIAGSVEETVKKNLGLRPWHVEGVQNAEWILIDYVDVAVHIFQPEARQHYNLENMWADAEIREHKPLPPPAPKPAKKPVRKTASKKKKAPAKKKSAKKKK